MQSKKDTPFDLDTTIRPQDDFYGYMNHKWLDAHPIPKSETRWGTFVILRDEAWANMHAIYKELENQEFTENTIEQQARDFYYSGMHFDSFEAIHLKEMHTHLKTIAAAQTLGDLCTVVGNLEAAGVAGLWRVTVDTDNEDATKHMLRLSQPELTLPDRDYYLDSSKKMQDIREAYEAHIKKLYTFFPEVASDGDSYWQAIWEIELGVAQASRTRVELRDVEKNYNRRSYASLKTEYKTVDWDAYARGLGWKTGADVSVDQPEFFAYIAAQLKERSLAEWKCYLTWRLLASYYGKISKRFADLRFEFFGKVLSGTQEILPLWKRVVLNIDAAMGEGVGRLYVERHFPESSKKQVAELVEQVRSAYRERITALDWMSEPTKKQALLKLANIKVLIGYPDTWRDFSSMHIGRTSYIANSMAGERAQTAYYLAKLSQPTSRDDWFMYPQTVNAYNDPSRLVICFPAAILQKPFFDPGAPAAMNMGGIGTVIGHELTHGFDDQGCMFDSEGNVRTWQTKEERAALEKRAQIIISQADHFEVLPGLYMKGKLVIGESIADLGGVEIAYQALTDALSDHIDDVVFEGFTSDQLFFMNYAATECSHTREERLRELTLSDPHPNEHFRVNGILSNVDTFYRVFKVTAQDALYRPPEERAKIW